jgi:hypothetical protein
MHYVQSILIVLCYARFKRHISITYERSTGGLVHVVVCSRYTALLAEWGKALLLQKSTRTFLTLSPQTHPHLTSHPKIVDEKMDPSSNKRKAEPDEANKRGWNKKTKVSSFLLCDHEASRSILSWPRDSILVLQA